MVFFFAWVSSSRANICHSVECGQLVLNARCILYFLPDDTLRNESIFFSGFVTPFVQKDIERSKSKTHIPQRISCPIIFPSLPQRSLDMICGSWRSGSTFSPYPESYPWKGIVQCGSVVSSAVLWGRNLSCAFVCFVQADVEAVGLQQKAKRPIRFLARGPKYFLRF